MWLTITGTAQQEELFLCEADQLFAWHLLQLRRHPSTSASSALCHCCVHVPQPSKGKRKKKNKVHLNDGVIIGSNSSRPNFESEMHFTRHCGTPSSKQGGSTWLPLSRLPPCLVVLSVFSAFLRRLGVCFWSRHHADSSTTEHAAQQLADPRFRSQSQCVFKPWRKTTSPKRGVQAGGRARGLRVRKSERRGNRI